MNKLLPTSTTLSISKACQQVNKKGFTLIELLVVISVIAILAVVGMVIFSGVQGRARDARRQSDVESIAKALESNKVSGAMTYPQISASWFAGSVVPEEPAGYTPQYTLIYTTAAGAAAGKPTAWDGTSANPTAPAGTTMAKVGPNIPTTGTIHSFQVCALLETGTAPNIFCRANTQ